MNYGMRNSAAPYSNTNERREFGRPPDRRQQNQRRNSDMDKPWVTQEIRREMWKKIQLGNIAKKTKSASDFKALEAQKLKVETLAEEARATWFHLNPQHEEEWLKVLADENLGRGGWCDVCEKGFQSAQLLKEHEGEHATCGIDGCTYTAHQDILEKHILHQHLSGLYNKIPHGNSPEEIEKWKAERRKNFPTRDKIVAKEAENAEMRARGEVMRLKRNKERQENAAREKEENKELDWECNCKARYLVRGNGRGGRGGGRGRRNFMQNLRHQGHCKELENIRRRAKERRETKATERFEKLKTKLESKDLAGNTKSVENPEILKAECTQTTVEEDSGSEDEEWNGGLFMFAGTAGLRTKEEEEEEEEAQQEDFHISDEEDNFGSAVNRFPEEEEEEGGAVFPSIDAAVEVTDRLVSGPTHDHHPAHRAEVDIHPAHRAEVDLHPTHRAEVDLHPAHRAEDGLSSEGEDSPPVEVKICKDAAEFEMSDIYAFKEKVLTTSAGDVVVDPEGDSERKRRTRKRKYNKDDTKELPERKKPTDVFSRPIRPPTLLERLLLDEIRRERNLILQCVRFVCKNEFLQN